MDLINHPLVAKPVIGVHSPSDSAPVPVPVDLYTRKCSPPANTSTILRPDTSARKLPIVQGAFSLSSFCPNSNSFCVSAFTKNAELLEPSIFLFIQGLNILGLSWASCTTITSTLVPTVLGLFCTPGICGTSVWLNVSGTLLSSYSEANARMLIDAGDKSKSSLSIA